MADIDLFRRLRSASDDLADVLVFALGTKDVERYTAYFTYHRLERRTTTASGVTLHIDSESTSLLSGNTSPEPESYATIDAPILKSFTTRNSSK